MRRVSILVSILALTLASASQAATPQMINYQGRLTDAGGAPVSDDSYSVVFTIYDAPAAGTSVWTETQSVNTIDGLFAVLLGSVTPMLDTVFNDTTRYLGIKVGGDLELIPRTRIVTAAYSFRTATVDGATGGIISGDVSIQSDLTVSGKATIGPGHTNTGASAFVAGQNNTASGDLATVGGAGNVASGFASTIAGGGNNSASGNYAAVGGGQSNNASGSHSTVPGGFVNFAGDTSATIGGGRNNRARGKYSVIAGGGGGVFADSNSALGAYSAIGGGRGNLASDTATTVGGGESNSASGSYATVGGGTENSATNKYSTIGGGNLNAAIGLHSTIGGGTFDTASALNSTVGGGSTNMASGGRSTVSGGGANTASGTWTSIAGGRLNAASGFAASVGGGESDTASGDYSTVAGGVFNRATGNFSMIPGGRACEANGIHSLAAGRRAKANHDASFVWADQNNSDFLSSAVNQFNIRASGGTRIFANSTLSAGVTLAAGASSWSGVSDSALKRNIREVNYHELLEKVAALPISQWSYEAQDESIEHIGPMAQDFYRLFGLGEDNKHINTLDPDGVALAAIKALYEKSKRVDALEARLEKLEKLLEEQHRK